MRDPYKEPFGDTPYYGEPKFFTVQPFHGGTPAFDEAKIWKMPRMPLNIDRKMVVSLVAALAFAACIIGAAENFSPFREDVQLTSVPITTAAPR